MMKTMLVVLIILLVFAQTAASPAFAAPYFLCSNWSYQANETKIFYIDMFSFGIGMGVSAAASSKEHRDIIIKKLLKSGNDILEQINKQCQANPNLKVSQVLANIVTRP